MSESLGVYVLSLIHIYAGQRGDGADSAVDAGKPGEAGLSPEDCGGWQGHAALRLFAAMGVGCKSGKDLYGEAAGGGISHRGGAKK